MTKYSSCFFFDTGALLQTTLGFNHSFGVACSLLSVLAYLLAGGLYAGTFTDAVQFIYLVMGLVSRGSLGLVSRLS